MESPEDWKEWARGNRRIAKTGAVPPLEFTGSVFRRRLSQISRMTIQVIHDLLPLGDNTRIIFLSFRGEITQQLKINRTLIEDRTVMPSAFSLSVFNTPPALASIALNLTAGYSALYPAAYPGEGQFYAGLAAAAARVLQGAEPEAALVYADELVPETYRGLTAGEWEPLAFGALISAAPTGIPLPRKPAETPPGTGGPGTSGPDGAPWESPQSFLKYLYRRC
jgi:hypothetical protein